MKKIVYLLGLVLLSSCGDADKFDDWAQPQGSVQEAAKSVGFTVTAAPVVDFESVGEDSIVLCSPVLTVNDEIKRQTYTITLYNADKSASKSLSVDAKGRVKAIELQTAVEDLYGKAGELRKIPATVVSQVVLARGEAFTQKADIEVQVKLITPDFAEFIYGIGDADWNKSFPVRSAGFDGNYSGYGYLKSAFKFRSKENEWGGPDWEYGGTTGILSENGTGDIPIAAEGFYKVDASLANNTYSVTKLDIAVVGSATGSWDVDQDMTYKQADNSWNWTGNLADGEIKFRANDGWDFDWGGTPDNITFKGGDMTVTAGNYTIKLYLSYEGNNKAVITKN